MDAEWNWVFFPHHLDELERREGNEKRINKIKKFNLPSPQDEIILKTDINLTRKL